MITNDDAMDNVCEAIDIIERLPISESNLGATQRLRDLRWWVEIQVDGDWDSAERTHKEER